MLKTGEVLPGPALAGVADTYGLYMFYMKSWTCWESTMQNNPLSIWQNFHFLEIAN